MRQNQIQRCMLLKLQMRLTILKACRYQGKPKNYQPYGQTESYPHLK